MRYIVICLALVVLVGCTSQCPRRQVADASPPPSPNGHITLVATNPIVIVLGEVNNPGRLIWIPKLTLTRAIDRAGGFTDFADQSNVQIWHSDGKVAQFSYQQAEIAAANNPMLERGDVVYVGRRFF